MSTNLHGLGVLLAALALSSCATKSLVRYEDGAVIDARKNLKTTNEPTQYEVSFEKASEGAGEYLKLSVKRNDRVKEEWEDTYSKIGVYKKKCRGWMDPKFFGAVSTTKYCEFDALSFSLSHLLVIGFLWDIQIPFAKYGEEIESKEKEPTTTQKENSQIIDRRSPVVAKAMKLTIHKASASSALTEDGARFDFRALKLAPGNLPDNLAVKIEFGNGPLDVSQEFQSFVDSEKENARERLAAKEAEQRRPENRYKMAYCSNRNLFDAIFRGASMESDCIYALDGSYLKVTQSTGEGVLISPAHPEMRLPDKIFFVRTKKRFVDDDRVGRMLLRYAGPFKYRTVLGAEKTIHAFQYLEDY